jgi:hypothetical protein
MNDVDEEYIDDAFVGDSDQEEEIKESNVNMALAANRHIQNDLVDKEVEQVIRKNDD